MNRKVLLAVALPIVTVCLLIVRAELNVNSGSEWELSIEGYDPRDILRGHYLRFQVDYHLNEADEGCLGQATCCLCLTDVGERIPSVRSEDCNLAIAQCDSIIRSEFERSLNRFYIPEDFARHAESLLIEAQQNANAYLKVSISEGGKPVIKDLLIGSESLGTKLGNTPASDR